MEQIKGIFDSCYYLTEQGAIYNSKTKKYLKKDSRNIYKLKLAQGGHRSISIKKLYREVYNKEYCIDNIEDLQGEEWRRIEGASRYLCSNYGRIKSLQGYEAIILKVRANQKGYMRVDIIFDDKKQQSKLVHKLVAAAFLVPPKSLEYQVHHKDYNRENNSAANLEYLEPNKHRKLHDERRRKLKNDKAEVSNS